MALYVITDGNMNYIRRDATGKYVLVRGRKHADEFTEQWKAKKVLDNNLTPKKRKLFKVLEVTAEISGFQKQEKTDPAPVKKEDPIQEVKPTEKPDENVELHDLDELRKQITAIKKFIDNNEFRSRSLSDLLSVKDKEIIDIQHYIEFSELGNDDVLKTYAMLKDRLVDRRKIKNELSVLRQLSDCKMDAKMLNDVLNTMASYDSKMYSPRVLTTLFA